MGDGERDGYTVVTKAVTAEVGTTGLVRYGERVEDEWHQALKGAKAARTYREMSDNDSTIGASLRAMDALVRQVAWHTEPASDEPKGEEAAALLDSCIDDMSHTWADFVSEALSCVPYGFAPFEVLYKERRGLAADPRSAYDDGKVGWRKFSIRAQETCDGWDFDEAGGVRGMFQMAAPNFKRVLIPIEKMLIFRARASKGNPEGVSLLRPGFRSWFFLKRLQELEAIGIERDLVGLPVMQMPMAFFDARATNEKKEALRNYAKLLSQIRRNEHEGVIIPPELDEKSMPTGYKLSLLSSGGTRALDIAGSIVRYEQRIAQTLLTQFLFLGMDKVGSFSLSSNMTDLFASAIGALLDTIEETFHRYATGPLMAMNGYAPELWPRLRHGDIERADVAPLAESLVKLVDAGLLTPDSSLEDFLRAEARLPEREEAMVDMDDPLQPTGPTAAGEGGVSVEVNYVSLAIQRHAAIGDVSMVNSLRRKLAAMLGLEAPPDLSADDLQQAAAPPVD